MIWCGSIAPIEPFLRALAQLATVFCQRFATQHRAFRKMLIVQLARTRAVMPLVLREDRPGDPHDFKALFIG